MSIFDLFACSLQSGQYFKESKVVKLIKYFLQHYIDWTVNIVPNCCTLLANISKEPELLK